MEGLRCLCPHVFIVCFLFESLLDITKTENGERGAGSGEREQARGTENGETGSRNRIENEVTNRARVQVGFCSHFSFSRHRIRPYLVLEESDNGTA